MSNLDNISKWFESQGVLDYFGLATFLIIGLCLLISFMALVSHRFTTKPIAILITIFSGAAVYFINKYNIAIDRGMVMNVLNTDSSEISAFLSLHMVPYIILTGIPIFIILRSEIKYARSFKYLANTSKIFLISIIIALGLLYAQFRTIQRVVTSSNRYVVQTLVPINFIQSLGSIAQVSASEFYKKHLRKLEFKGSISQNRDLVVVLAVGETSRRQNFSIYGYDRVNTTPLLSRVENLHRLNGHARIGSTLYALPEILAKDGVPIPFVTHKLGINTSCYVNYTFYDMCETPGEESVSNCGHNGNCYDEDVIPLLKKNLSTYTSGYRFVALHLGGGSHGPSYHMRHPPEFQQFKPMCMDADIVSKCTKEQLYNSFDNTILYVDYVVSNLIETLESSKVPYVFIYLSDHGESLLEDGRIFHGMPLGVSLPPEQANIPLLVKASVPIEIKKRDEYSQRLIFDTILSLFSVEDTTVNPSQSFIELK